MMGRALSVNHKSVFDESLNRDECKIAKYGGLYHRQPSDTITALHSALCSLHYALHFFASITTAVTNLANHFRLIR